MSRTVNRTRAALLLAGGLILLGASSVVIVGEGDQAVVTRFGKPVGVINMFSPTASNAGAVLKLPLVDRVIWLARGLQSHSVADTKIHTSDARTLLVSSVVTYRIIDPVRLVGTLGSGSRVGEQLDAVVPALVEENLPQRDAQTIAGPGSGGSERQILAALDGKMRAYGVQVVDYRVGRVVLPQREQELALTLMRDRREAQIADINLQGSQDGQRIIAEADADAAAILQQSAAKDLAFYDYFSSLRNYAAIFGNPQRKDGATIVIPPDSDYLKHFNGK